MERRPPPRQVAEVSDSRHPLGVVLLEFGGPRSAEDIQPFLERRLLDPTIFSLSVPEPMRNWLARNFSAWRARSIRTQYETIGGQSPVREIPLLQAKLLEAQLCTILPCRVVVATRHGSPSTEDAIEAVESARCGRVLLLPLYPQFSLATTGSSLREWTLRCSARGVALPTDRIESYYSSPAYIDAVAARIGESLRRFPSRDFPHIVFSAHGLPRKLVFEGDPYRTEIEETVRLVSQRLPSNQGHTLCYQNGVGPQRCLRPSLQETIRALARASVESVLVVPISYVSDHFETLIEIDIEAREIASACGIRQFETMRAINESPLFIRALAQEVLARVRGPEGSHQ